MSTSVRTADETIRGFSKSVAAETSVPGGGSVSAVAAALASALGAMACRFTVGREKFKEGEAEAASTLAFLEKEADAFLALADEDAAAYGLVSAAMKLPKESAEEKAARGDAIQAALVKAARPPLEVARRALDAADRIARLRGVSNPNLASDLGVGLYLAAAAARGALLNVFVNVASLKAEANRAPLESEALALWRRLATVEEEGLAVAEKIAGRPLR